MTDPPSRSDTADLPDLPDLLRENNERGSPIKRGLLLAGAALCFAGGVVGWLVPVVTGIPFYVAGVVLLGMASRRVRRLINRLERKLSPRTRRRLRRAVLKIPIASLRRMVNVPPEPEPD